MIRFKNKVQALKALRLEKLKNNGPSVSGILRRVLGKIQKEAFQHNQDLMIAYDRVSLGFYAYEITLATMRDSLGKITKLNIVVTEEFLKYSYEWALIEFFKSKVRELFHIRKNGFS
jgi:hypothetical protein